VLDSVDHVLEHRRYRVVVDVMAFVRVFSQEEDRLLESREDFLFLPCIDTNTKTHIHSTAQTTPAGLLFSYQTQSINLTNKQTN